jgi:hypothetical protein
MASGGKRDLSWAKRETPDKPPIAVTGVQGSNIRVFARATVGGGQQPRFFKVWERHWFDRLARALRVSTSPVSLQLESRIGAMWLSEPYRVAAPEYPGQARYYFEDDAQPKRNRSGDLGVSHLKCLTELREVAGPSGVLQLDGSGAKVGVLPSYVHRVNATYELSAAVDPDVVVGVLVPWGEGERSLRVAALRWALEHHLEGRLLEIATALAPTTATLEDALDVLAGDVLGRRQDGWQIELMDSDDRGDRRLVVGPGAPGVVDVQITLPPSGGRTSFAISVVDEDDPQRPVVGTVVELEVKGEEFRFGELSLDAPDEQ